MPIKRRPPQTSTPRSPDVRLVTWFFRIAVPVALMAAAAFGAGWKWEGFPH